MFKVPESKRVTDGPWKSDSTYGNNGAFVIKVGPADIQAIAIASQGNDQIPWEHVSVSIPGRCPTWEEMCQVKDMFWDEEDCVIQYHPPRSLYCNLHPTCLHLWRYTGTDHQIPIPHPMLIVPRVKQ